MVWCVSEGECGVDEFSGMLVGCYVGLLWSGGISRVVQIWCKDWDGGGFFWFCKDVFGFGFWYIFGIIFSIVFNWIVGCVVFVFGF